MRRAALQLLLVIAALSGGGCARYQFSIIEPPDIAAAIERHGERAVNRPPLEYTFFDVRSAGIGVRIANTADEPVQLHGERSYVVDPDGQTHQMHSGTIAPRSYIEFALPPAVRVYDPGPRFTIGFGSGYYGDHHHAGFGTVFGPAYPREYVVRPWIWRTGDVRFHAEFELEGDRFVHEFLFRRERTN
jgi:hypothetical protein